MHNFISIKQSKELQFFISLAEWQSGHAADCKSVYAGSIPTSASINLLVYNALMPGWWNW